MRLGLFTGFRVLEYAETRLAAKVRYTANPRKGDVGVCAGQALAFFRAPFPLFHSDHQRIKNQLQKIVS